MTNETGGEACRYLWQRLIAVGGSDEFGVSFVDFLKSVVYRLAGVRGKPFHVARNLREGRSHDLEIFIEDLR